MESQEKNATFENVIKSSVIECYENDCIHNNSCRDINDKSCNLKHLEIGKDGKCMYYARRNSENLKEYCNRYGLNNLLDFLKKS